MPIIPQCELCNNRSTTVFIRTRQRGDYFVGLCGHCAGENGWQADWTRGVFDVFVSGDVMESLEAKIHVRRGRSPLVATFDVGESSLKISDAVSRKLMEYFAMRPQELKTMNRRLFEEFVAELWRGFGYDVELTAQTRDGGRDVIALKNDHINEKILIECKRPGPEKVIGVRPVRELLGVKVSEGATKAVLATTVFFSPDATLLFEQMKWELEGRDYDGLQHWIQKYLEKRGVGKW